MVVSRVSNDYTNSQMASEIAQFFNSWRPETFQITEDTGFDIEGIFDEDDSYNMMAVKRAADISLVLCITSIIITIAIYVYFIDNGFKEVLAKRAKVAVGISLIVMIIEIVLMYTTKGLSFLSSVLGLEPLGKGSLIKILLGTDFLHMATIFFAAYTIVVCIAVLYITHVFTKSPRIFY
jgi:hypothetical protein